MNLTSKENLLKLLKSLPAAIPYAGHVYSDYVTSTELDGIRNAIEAIDSQQQIDTRSILRDLGLQQESINRILLLLESLQVEIDASNGLTQTNCKDTVSAIRISQHATHIYNVNGDINNNIRPRKRR